MCTYTVALYGTFSINPYQKISINSSLNVTVCTERSVVQKKGGENAGKAFTDFQF